MYSFFHSYFHPNNSRKMSRQKSSTSWNWCSSSLTSRGIFLRKLFKKYSNNRIIRFFFLWKIKLISYFGYGIWLRCKCMLLLFVKNARWKRIDHIRIYNNDDLWHFHQDFAMKFIIHGMWSAFQVKNSMVTIKYSKAYDDFHSYLQLTNIALC